jgi:lipopolysaccharide assembly outer membrane protein LptD (OstA)
MKRFAIGFAITSAIVVVALPALSQSGSTAEIQVPKHIYTTMQNGLGNLTFEADNIDREWVPSIVHLKGNVLVQIRTVPKNNPTMTLLNADEVDYNETTGEFSPRGNVRLTVEAAK